MSQLRRSQWWFCGLDSEDPESHSKHGRSASVLLCISPSLCSSPRCFSNCLLQICAPSVDTVQRSPGGLRFREEHCCVQMFIVGCGINDFNYLEASCGFGLTSSHLASLTFLPWGSFNLSVSSFTAFQDLIKHIQVSLNGSQCWFPQSNQHRNQRC